MLVEGKHDSNNEERFWYIELVHRGYRGNLSHPRSIVVFFHEKTSIVFSDVPLPTRVAGPSASFSVCDHENVKTCQDPE